VCLRDWIWLKDACLDVHTVCFGLFIACGLDGRTWIPEKVGIGRPVLQSFDFQDEDRAQSDQNEVETVHRVKYFVFAIGTIRS
jgi:hypothetical protein